MSRRDGKKIGKLSIRLDRVLGPGDHMRSENARMQVDLKIDSRGMFHADYEGNHYEAETQKALHDLIKAAVDTTLNLVWRRYIVVKYTMASCEVDASGHRTTSNSDYEFDLNEDRARLLTGDPDSHWNREPRVITGIGLDWKVVEYSEPFAPPENKSKLVRQKRSIYTRTKRDDDGNDLGLEESTGAPHEQDDDALPVGGMPWTAEREDFLRQIRDALGKLDARMVALFNGVGDELAERFDKALASRINPEFLLRSGE